MWTIPFEPLSPEPGTVYVVHAVVGGSVPGGSVPGGSVEPVVADAVFGTNGPGGTVAVVVVVSGVPSTSKGR